MPVKTRRPYSLSGVFETPKPAAQLHDKPRVAVRPKIVKSTDVTTMRLVHIARAGVAATDVPVRVVMKPLAVKQYADIKPARQHVKTTRQSPSLDNKSAPAPHQVSAAGRHAPNRPAHLQRYTNHISTYKLQPKSPLEAILEARTQTGEATEAPAEHATKKKVKARKFGAKLAVSLAVVVLFAGLGIFGFTIYTNKRVLSEIASAAESEVERPDVAADEAPVTDDEIKSYRVAPDEPRRLMVESLGVNARILKVGINKESSIDTPKNIFDTGWFTGSKKPGTGGASLIVGHYSGSTRDGVFSDLHRIENGALITVERGDGQLITYKVVDKRRYAATEIDLAAALSPVRPGTESLNLITCGGSFDNVNNVYRERVVVFTERVDVPSENTAEL